jgi:cytidine deaminase
MDMETLIAEAKKLVGEFRLAGKWMTAGSVGAALVTDKGHIYTGICLDMACGIGFCAEHSAIAEMLKNRETRIELIVAVDEAKILSPCGRCRELMIQVNAENRNTRVVLKNRSIVPLSQLLPDHWLD